MKWCLANEILKKVFRDEKVVEKGLVLKLVERY